MYLVESSNDSDSDDGTLRLDKVVEHDSMQVAFEFSDMKDEHREGITVLLKWLLPSHEAYELACVICNQGINQGIFSKEVKLV